MSNFTSPLIQFSLALSLVKIAMFFAATKSGLQSKSRVLLNRYLESMFLNAGYNYDLESILRIILSLVLVSAVFGLVISPVFALLCPFIFLMLSVAFLRRRARLLVWETSRINDEVCFFIARSLRSGQTLEKSVLNTDQEFPSSLVISAICKRLRGGMSLVGAIDRVAKSSSNEFNTVEKTLCATISLAQQMGGNSARVFERIGDNFHQSYGLVEDAKAALAQVKLSVYVISVLPLAMFGFSLLLGSESALYLFTNPLGLVCFVFGFALETVGIFWMKRLVDRGVKSWSL